MNRKIIPLVLVGLVVLAGGFGAWYFLKSKITPQTVQQEAIQKEAGQKSLKQLISLGLSQKCTYQTKIGDIQRTGTFYLTKNRTRAEVETIDQDGTNKSFIVSTPEYTYIWSDADDNGFKFYHPEQSEDSEDGETSSNFGLSGDIDSEGEYDYKCSPWVVNDETFTPPENIKFLSSENLALPDTSNQEE